MEHASNRLPHMGWDWGDEEAVPKKFKQKGAASLFFSSCLFGSLFSYLFNDESFPLKPLLAWFTPGKRAAVQATGRKRVQAVQEPAGAAAAGQLPLRAAGERAWSRASASNFACSSEFALFV